VSQCLLTASSWHGRSSAIDEADNGSIAVERVRAQPSLYHALIMDKEMPVMVRSLRKAAMFSAKRFVLESRNAASYY
jgi:CheY-like chemotaxis protein